MLSQVFYLLRSKKDGQYLAVHPPENGEPNAGYLLLFQEDYAALSYLNTHAADIVQWFSVESISATQLSGLFKRWGFIGIGIVQDPLPPTIEFLTQQ